MAASVVGPLAALALVAVSAGTFLVQAKSPLETQTLPVVAFTGLPVQGQKVMDLIRQGGPFRYEKDGTVFGNRERLLPAQKRGYYREYTVPTPGCVTGVPGGSCAVGRSLWHPTTVITPRTTTPASG
jgi:ribonuclease T1